MVRSLLTVLFDGTSLFPMPRRSAKTVPTTIYFPRAEHRALRMEAARGTGKPINSTTFQNLATNSIVSRIAGNPLVSGLGAQFASPGPMGFFMGQAATAATKQMLERSENLVRDALLERILNFSGKGEATLARKTAARSPTPGAPWNPLNAGPPPP